MNNIVYALTCPRTGEVRYVGKSTSGLNRPRQHWALAIGRNERGHKANWIRKLKREGLRYGISVLLVLDDAVKREDHDAAEVFWISEMVRRGHRLTNIMPGGQGGAVVGVAKVNHAEAMRRLWQTEGHRALHRAGCRARSQRPEWKERCAEAQRKLSLDPEHRAVVTAKNRRLAQDPEWRRKSHEANLAAQKRPEVIEAKRRAHAHEAKAIDRIHPGTGEVKEYPSIHAAVRDGYPLGNVWLCLQGKRGKCGGFFWNQA